MYKNVGKQIKALAEILCWVHIVVGSLASILVGCIYSGLINDVFHLFGYGGILYSYNRVSTVYVILFTLLGILLSVFFGWLSGLILYAFGELVDRSKSIDEKLNKTNE